MVKPIYMISGRKGGVGKSIVSMALVDYLQALGVDVVLIETDDSTPDVGRTYRHSVESRMLELDESDGWMDLVNVCVDRPDSTIVINGAARDSKGVDKYGKMFNDALPQIQRKLVTLWVINQQRDSLEMLKSFMAVIPQSAVHVVRNGFYGTTGKFDLYNGSDLRKRIEGRGGKSVTFPDLADRVANELYSTPMSIAVAMKELPMGNRVELARWRGVAREMFEEIIDE